MLLLLLLLLVGIGLELFEISQLVSLGCSLSADSNIRGSTPRGTPENLGPK